MTIPSSDPLAARSPAANPLASSRQADDHLAAGRLAGGPLPGGLQPSVAPAAVPQRSARRLAWHFGVVLLGASVLANIIGGPSAALSAAFGVALAGANLVLMQAITRAMLGSGSAEPGHGPAAEAGGMGSAAWGLALPFKLVGLVGVAYALVKLGVAQPVPLAMGFAILPLTGVFLPRPTSVPQPRPLARRSP